MAEKHCIHKILLYINTIHGGGAQRVMVNLAQALARRGIETVLVTSFQRDKEYPLDESVRRICLENKPIKQSQLRRNISRILKLRRICREEKPDVVLSFMGEPNFRTVIATRGLPVKTVVSVRNDPQQEYSGKVRRLVGKKLLPLADGCVFQTRDAQTWFPELLQKKSAIIYNPVKTEFFHLQRMPVPGEIVTVGRLEPQKNHALLIDAFSQLQNHFPQATLKIYGEGSLHQQLERKISELGLVGKVRLMGATNDVPAALQTASLFVLSSDFEGMPNALMEAMAAGVPCISTDCPCGGPRELFGTELADSLIPCKDESALVAAIEAALTGADRGKSFQKCAAKFAPERVYDDWIKYLNKVQEGGENYGN